MQHFYTGHYLWVLYLRLHCTFFVSIKNRKGNRRIVFIHAQAGCITDNSYTNITNLKIGKHDTEFTFYSLKAHK